MRVDDEISPDEQQRKIQLFPQNRAVKAERNQRRADDHAAQRQRLRQRGNREHVIPHTKDHSAAVQRQNGQKIEKQHARVHEKRLLQKGLRQALGPGHGQQPKHRVIRKRPRPGNGQSPKPLHGAYTERITNHPAERRKFNGFRFFAQPVSRKQMRQLVNQQREKRAHTCPDRAENRNAQEIEHAERLYFELHGANTGITDSPSFRSSKAAMPDMVPMAAPEATLSPS